MGELGGCFLAGVSVDGSIPWRVLLLLLLFCFCFGVWGLLVGFSTDDDILWTGLDGCSMDVQGRGILWEGVFWEVCVSGGRGGGFCR